ncbi:zinc metalloprotease [Ferrimonas marina]|nr:hypothetical protein [Ferrimonas marina]
MRLSALTVACATLLIGCGSDSDTDNSWSNQQLFDTIKCSNLRLGKPSQPDSYCTANSGYAWGDWDHEHGYCKGQYCFEDKSPAPEHPGLTRFIQGELIPVYYLGSEDPRFAKAMDRAEAIVGYPMFDRSGGVIELELGEWWEPIDYSHLPTEWGFIWSQGTSPGNCSSGTVSKGPNMSNLVSYLADRNQGLLRNVPDEFTWINIDSGAEIPGEGCTIIADDEVTLHELGHALGMGNHFQGFGDGAAFDANAERVLRTMYSPHNPPGQPFDALYPED